MKFLCFVSSCEGSPVVKGKIIVRGEEKEVLACENCKWRIRPKHRVPLTEQNVIEIFVGVDEVTQEPVEVEEKLYLVCACGEAFDDLRIAKNHNCPDFGDFDKVFQILPEREAM